MKLEILDHTVRECRLVNGPSRYRKGILTVDRQELEDMRKVLKTIASIRAEVVYPGESCRIVHPLDAVQPIIKSSPQERSVFPGILSSPLQVGFGTTHRLTQFHVISCARFQGPYSGIESPRDSILEMSGPGAEFCYGSDTINLVIQAEQTADSSDKEFDSDLRVYLLRLARRLGELALQSGDNPDVVSYWQLNDCDRSLPKVVYIDQTQDQGMYVRAFLYGREVRHLWPTVLHPNELIDGAMVSGNYKSERKRPTALLCNNPFVNELMHRHGKEINFLGVVITRGYQDSHDEKQGCGEYAAKTAKMLGAKGVLLSWEGTGNSTIDLMHTAKACIEQGLKPVVVVHESCGLAGDEPPLVYHLPEVTHLVSTGIVDLEVVLPPVERVVGGNTVTVNLVNQFDPSEMHKVGIHNLFASHWAMGLRDWKAADF
jgi:sarcosine reductase